MEASLRYGRAYLWNHADPGILTVISMIGLLSAERESGLLHAHYFLPTSFVVVCMLRADAIWGHQKVLRVSLISVYLVCHSTPIPCFVCSRTSYQVTSLLGIYFTSKHIASARGEHQNSSDVPLTDILSPYSYSDTLLVWLLILFRIPKLGTFGRLWGMRFL